MAQYRLTVLSGDDRVSRFFINFENESEAKDFFNSVQDAADSGKTVKIPILTGSGKYTQYLRPSNAVSWNVFKFIPNEDEDKDIDPGIWEGVFVEDDNLVQ